MADDPIDLDTRRDVAAQQSIEVRRRLLEVNADQAILRQREEAHEYLLTKTWPSAAKKAQYLIRRFAATPQAQDPRLKKLIANSLAELTRLRDEAKQH